jgi:thiamine biosynthesis lipoprotein
MKILQLSILLSLLVSCSSQEKFVEVSGETMGTYYKVKSFTSDSPQDLKEKTDKFLRLFNNVFSTYVPTSELSKINSSEFKRFELSKSMKKIMILSLEVYKKSGGYFDVTVGPLVNAWGFGPDGKQKKPSSDQIEKLLKFSSSDHLKLNDNILRLNQDGIYIDLSAIAKGFAVDELIKFLDFNGHKNFLVEIGGEVRTRGKKSDGSTWKLGIEGPSSKLGTKISKVVPLTNMGMATSGSYRNFVKYGDEVFNHTINPKTGLPVTHKTISVSVLHEYCADADAWATAFMSMGAQKGIEIANNQDLPVYFQVKDGDEIKVITSRAFNKYMKKNKD